jgi:hypothetical protein
MTSPKYTADELRVWEGFAGEALNGIACMLALDPNVQHANAELCLNAEVYVDNAAGLADMMMQRRNDRKAR